MNIYENAEGIKKTGDMKETAIYLLAERLIRDAIKKGSQLINVKCHPKERFFADKGEFLDMVEEDENSPIKLRNRGWVVGISIRENGKDLAYMSLPPSLLLPLVTIYSEKTAGKGKQGFAIYCEPSRTTLEKLFAVTLYLENDSSISIEFKEIEA
jgi:hypothetical protein